MKKLVLSALAIALSFSTISATNLHKAPVESTVNYSVKISAFCQLIKEGNYSAVKSLIENGTNINRKSVGLTPLMFAARYNKTQIVKLLISKGAKLKTKSERGRFTALQYAKMSKATESYNLISEALKK